MLMSPKIRELTFDEAPDRQRSAGPPLAEGMRTLYWDGIEKVMRGVTTLDEVFAFGQATRRSTSRIRPTRSRRSAVGRSVSSIG